MASGKSAHSCAATGASPLASRTSSGPTTAADTTGTSASERASSSTTMSASFTLPLGPPPSASRSCVNPASNKAVQVARSSRVDACRSLIRPTVARISASSSESRRGGV